MQYKNGTDTKLIRFLSLSLSLSHSQVYRQNALRCHNPFIPLDEKNSNSSRFGTRFYCSMPFRFIDGAYGYPSRHFEKSFRTRVFCDIGYEGNVLNERSLWS